MSDHDDYRQTLVAHVVRSLAEATYSLMTPGGAIGAMVRLEQAVGPLRQLLELDQLAEAGREGRRRGERYRRASNGAFLVMTRGESRLREMWQEYARRRAESANVDFPQEWQNVAFVPPPTAPDLATTSSCCGAEVVDGVCSSCCDVREFSTRQMLRAVDRTLGGLLKQQHKNVGDAATAEAAAAGDVFDAGRPGDPPTCRCGHAKAEHSASGCNCCLCDEAV